jgi:Uncharacterised nucleotidyltransferase
MIDHITGPWPIRQHATFREVPRHRIVLGSNVVGNSLQRSRRGTAPSQPEFALLRACARWPSDENAAREIRRCVAAPLDWERFLTSVSRHRLTSLAFHALHTRDRCVPPRIMERLSGAARSETRRTMRRIAETARLIDVLSRAGIGALVLKGPALSIIAFGDPFRRDSRDIDLVVGAEYLDGADAILRSEGYERKKPEPGMSPRQLARYRQWVHEFFYYSPDRKLIVEVKDRVDPMMSVPLADLEEHLRSPKTVDVGGVQLPTLPDVDHFLYLCAHGTRHAWFRLKWVADIAAMVRLKSLDLEVVGTRALELDLERCLSTALLLAQELMDAPICEALLARARSDSRVRRLAGIAHQFLKSFGLDSDPTKGFATLRLLVAECSIRSDWSYRRMVLQRYALSYAYPVLRPMIQMVERLRPSS